MTYNSHMIWYWRELLRNQPELRADPDIQELIVKEAIAATAEWREQDGPSK